MVRLKTRYILFEIIYPELNGDGEEGTDWYKTRSNSIIALHKQSPSVINAKVIILAIRKSLQLNYGDLGSGCDGMSLVLKYFSNRTSTGIIRVLRESYMKICSAICLINELNGYKVIIRCVNLSGSIKKCEDKSIIRSEKLMKEILNSSNKSNTNNNNNISGGIIISSVIEKEKNLDAINKMFGSSKFISDDIDKIEAQGSDDEEAQAEEDFEKYVDTF
ncbi:ribonuclease activity protein [[Candida] boidinii]|nr:ribonuclease activity protein [[Candida] boidinii]OWB79773.1 ribonuclease activity protein [[Candida] boidinii]